MQLERIQLELGLGENIHLGSRYAVRPFTCYAGEIFQLAPPTGKVPQVASRLLLLRGRLETRYLEAAKERQAP